MVIRQMTAGVHPALEPFITKTLVEEPGTDLVRTMLPPHPVDRSGRKGKPLAPSFVITRKEICAPQ